jgi:DNA-binding LytR/AlgR family response regulator
MFQIAFCEDEKIFAETQEELCRNICDSMDIEYGIDVYDNSNSLFTAYIQEEKRYDLLILDIIMDGMNGVELARKIRQADADVAIAFLTSSANYLFKGYKATASSYIMKGGNKEKQELEELIKEVYENKYQPSCYILKAGSHTHRIRIKEIIALETVVRRVEIIATDGVFYYTGTLDDLLSELPNGLFTRCHKGFAVNINLMREIDRLEIIAVNGKRIPISRPFMNDVKAAFLNRVRNI